MKIVYCLPDTFRPGGIERIVSIKANYLADKMNYDVFIVTTGQQGKCNYYSFSERIKFIDLGINYDETLLLPFIQRIIERHNRRQLHKKKLTSLLLETKADIVISTFTHEADFLPRIKDGSKKILEFHFCRGYKKFMGIFYSKSFLTKLAYEIQNWIDENFVIHKYDKFILLTDEDSMRWAGKADNTIVIPNALSFEHSLKADLTNKSVIAVGRYDAQKGFDRLINIWRYVHEICPEWHLKIYGQGSDKQKLEKQIKDLNLQQKVHLFSPDPNIVEQFLVSAVCVMTSNFEGFGLVLTEAMECGVPCVAYHFPCGPEDIIKNGEDGYLVDNGNEQDFVNKLTDLLLDENKRKRFGTNAKTNVRRFSKTEIMPQWTKLFNDLLK